MKIPFAPIPGDFKQILSSPKGIALLEGDCYSAAVIPPPKDWPNSVYQASYCFLDTVLNREHNFTPSQQLQDFLAQDPKPFYVGFGSMIPRHPEHLAETIVSALTATGQRAVLCSGWGNVAQNDLPPSIYLLDSVPHEWLFPKVVGAIHHGGAGTSAATLKAGIPSVVVPFSLLAVVSSLCRTFSIEKRVVLLLTMVGFIDYGKRELFTLQ